MTSFDWTLSQSVRNDLPDLVGSTILPVVQNGTLPQVVTRVGQGLHTLVDDQVDPQRKTLTAMANLANSPTLVESAMVTDLAAGLLVAGNLPEVLHSTRLLMDESDGVDTVMNDVLGLVTHGSSGPASTCTGLALGDVQGTLLRTDGFVDDPHYALGDPGWMVRPDIHGNPKVLVDVATGKLASPFIDVDGDGAADTDAVGQPVDAYGDVIDLPYLGTIDTRDAAGRALNSHGGLLYDYYDIKRTPLSFSMQIAADFLDAGIHHQIPAIADAVLGTPVVCNDGTTTCRAYSATDNPLADLSFLGLEMLRFPQTSKLMDVLHQLFLTDPDKAEDLLVAAGDAIGALQSSTVSLTDTSMYDALIGIVPLIRQIFTTSNTSGKSTPRLLVDLLASMTPSEKAQIEQSLGWMIEYKSLASRPNPDPSGPQVDYTRNRFYQSGGTWIDNRSGLEQAIELLGYADCGFIGCSQGALSTSCVAATALDGVFGNPDDGTVSAWLLGAMSSKSPSTVSSLISFINWLNGFSIPLVCNGAGCALQALGCSSSRADAAAAHIPALQSLANSGGLDWLLPIARVFQAQHQMPALVDDLRLRRGRSVEERRVQPQGRQCQLLRAPARAADPVGGARRCDRQVARRDGRALRHPHHRRRPGELPADRYGRLRHPATHGEHAPGARREQLDRHGATRGHAHDQHAARRGERGRRAVDGRRLLHSLPHRHHDRARRPSRAVSPEHAHDVRRRPAGVRRSREPVAGGISPATSISSRARARPT